MSDTGKIRGKRAPGLVVRVPAETERRLRETAGKVPRGALETEEEVVRKLALRALALGVDDERLVPGGGQV